MATDTALIEKREELKRRLVAGEYKTLVDIFLEWFERLLRKITCRSELLPLWLITVILCVMLQPISFAGIYMAGDWGAYRKLGESFGLGYQIGLLIIIMNGSLFIITAIIINQYISRLTVLWRDKILDATESETSLKEAEDWLKKTCDWRLHLLVTLIPSILMGPYQFSLTRTLIGMPIGYGVIFSTFILNLIAWSFIYQLLMVIRLSVKLRSYDIKLFAADPGSSEIMSRLSSELGFFVYYIAVLIAILILVITAAGFLSSLGIILVLLFGLPIIALFILNQTSLSSIVRRAKWKTLNEAQAKIEKLRASKNFGNQETMDAIKRLMDYHDRVKATRDSALDFRTYLSFINSLLLPLLAFLIGNLDLVLSLFKKQP